jgi:hypothetical protein
VCPESGDAGVRKIQGRCYSNEEIINTVKVCQKLSSPDNLLFLGGAGGRKQRDL